MRVTLCLAHPRGQAALQGVEVGASWVFPQHLQEAKGLGGCWLSCLRPAAHQAIDVSSSAFVTRQQRETIKISWSGRKRCYDNILEERQWRKVKYEGVYLRAYSDGWEAEISLARFLWRYCHVRPHSSLGGSTPHAVYTEKHVSPARS